MSKFILKLKNFISFLLHGKPRPVYAKISQVVIKVMQFDTASQNKIVLRQCE